MAADYGVGCDSWTHERTTNTLRWRTESLVVLLDERPGSGLWTGKNGGELGVTTGDGLDGAVEEGRIIYDQKPVRKRYAVAAAALCIIVVATTWVLGQGASGSHDV